MQIVASDVGETLLIGATIRITVLAVHGEELRIGISAPRSVVIQRGEIADRARGGSDLAPLNRLRHPWRYRRR